MRRGLATGKVCSWDQCGLFSFFSFFFSEVLVVYQGMRRRGTLIGRSGIRRSGSGLQSSLGMGPWISKRGYSTEARRGLATGKECSWDQCGLFSFFSFSLSEVLVMDQGMRSGN